MGCGRIAFFGGGSVVRCILAVIVRYPVQSRTTKAKKQGVFRWFGGSVVRWFGRIAFFGGLVVRPHCFFRWFGGSVVRWLGGLVAWWLGGLVAWWLGGAKSHFKIKETGQNRAFSAGAKSH